MGLATGDRTVKHYGSVMCRRWTNDVVSEVGLLKPVKVTNNKEYSSLLCYEINYGRNNFYGTGPLVFLINIY